MDIDKQKLKIIAFALVLLVLIMAIIFTGAIIKSKKDKPLPPSPVAETPPKADVLDMLSEDDRKHHLDYKLLSAATKEKNTAKCNELLYMEKDGCIFSVARFANDIKICDEITEAASSTKCRESFLYDKIIGQSEITRCHELTNSELLKQCLTHFFWQYDSATDCADQQNENKTLCTDIVHYNLASKKNDESQCGLIKNDALKSDCFSIVQTKPRDSDSDGLLDSDEISYGTNPFLADTDGDGQSDLDEMSKYFTDPKDPNSKK